MAITEGDSVVIEYVGSFEDGTVFDTSRYEVAREHGLVEAQGTDAEDYGSLSFRVGDGEVIEGLETGVIGLSAGETATDGTAADETTAGETTTGGDGEPADPPGSTDADGTDADTAAGSDATELQFDEEEPEVEDDAEEAEADGQADADGAASESDDESETSSDAASDLDREELVDRLLDVQYAKLKTAANSIGYDGNLNAATKDELVEFIADNGDELQDRIGGEDE